jgi:hypothetical protein
LFFICILHACNCLFIDARMGSICSQLCPQHLPHKCFEVIIEGRGLSWLSMRVYS